jgi:hypothetical protein
MNLPPLQKLKQKLLHDKDLGPVWTFFLDYMAENSDFMSRGQSTRDPLVETLVAQIGKQMFPDGGKVANLMLRRIPEEQFIHGAFTIGHHLGGIFYFEDAQTGLMSAAEGLSSDQVKFARFSARAVRDAAPPGRN